MHTATIDLTREQLISLPEAAKILSAARPISRIAVWRWAARGLRVGNRMVRLETVAIGARLFTTQPAIQRFQTLVDAPRRQAA